jgi:hypothetical protein
VYAALAPVRIPGEIVTRRGIAVAERDDASSGDGAVTGT